MSSLPRDFARCLFVVLLAGAPIRAQAGRVVFDETGTATLYQEDQATVEMQLSVFGPTWSMDRQENATDTVAVDISNDARSFSGRMAIRSTDDGKVAYEELAERLSGGRVGLTYDTTVETSSATVNLNRIEWSMDLPVATFGDVEATIGSVSFGFPVDFNGAAHQSWAADRIVLPLGVSGEILTIDFSSVASISFQDNREWGGSYYNLRVNIRGEEELPNGTTDHLKVTLTSNEELEVQLGPEQVVHDTSAWCMSPVPFWESIAVLFIAHRVGDRCGRQGR